MTRDTRDEALDKIQDIADFLPIQYELPDEVPEYLCIIKALARHRDVHNCLDTKDN